MKIKHIVLSFWYKELEYNPASKVGMLEGSLASNFVAPFLINEQEPFINLALPRIVARGKDNSCSLNMSLATFNLEKVFEDDVNYDDVILYVNENLQLLYDVLCEIYDVRILFSSIKVEMVEINDNALQLLEDKLFLRHEDNLEDLVVKKGFSKDNKYYINYTNSSNKEVRYDIKLPNSIKPNENDMYTRSMLISLSEANVGSPINTTIFEINDRLSYNNDRDYYVTKENIRDLIFEFKLLLNKIKE